MLTDRRILYVQFTNPVGYPPIEHSARLLADRGWDILLLGTGTFSNQNFQFSYHPRIRLKNIPFVRGGFRQKVLYVYFLFWTLYWTLRWKPKWIYASDPLACPIVWIIQQIADVHVIYHEHDSPGADRSSSRFMRMVYAYRCKLARVACLCVLPQSDRLRRFLDTTNRMKPTFCVWNCPRLSEIPDAAAHHGSGMIIYYHGSITRQRLPPSLIIAASRFRGAVQIYIAGFEVLGAVGYVQELLELAVDCGGGQLVKSLGTITPRDNLFRVASKADVGLSLMPKTTDDPNLRQMVGASNKAFDYMACALPLLVSDLPEWVSTFVEPGYARSCDPDDVDSMEAAMRWYLDHPVERRAMGLRSQDKIRRSWNYETMFADVLSEIERD
jgi:glycosyltransferase involved in cell wall biosynthesis